MMMLNPHNGDLPIIKKIQCPIKILWYIIACNVELTSFQHHDDFSFKYNNGGRTTGTSTSNSAAALK